MKIKCLGLFAVLFAALSWVGCDDDATDLPDGFELEEVFTLEAGAEESCVCDESLAAQFVEVTDESRCPTDAVCIWEGQVIVSVNFNGENILLGNSPGNNPNVQQNRDTVGNFIIVLDAVRPYPVLDEPISPEEYEIDLLVTEL